MITENIMYHRIERSKYIFKNSYRMKQIFFNPQKNIKIFLKHLNNNLEYYGPNCYENRSYPRFRRNMNIRDYLN